MTRLQTLTELQKYFPTDLCNVILTYTHYKEVPWKQELELKELTQYIDHDSEHGYYFADLISICKPKYNLRKSTLSLQVPRLNLWLTEYFDYSDDNFREDFVRTTDCKPTLSYLCDSSPKSKFKYQK
jgi:hypothetical protein